LRFMRHCLGKGLRDWRVHKILLGARLPRATRPALAWMLERRGRRYEAGFLRCFSGRPLPVGAYWRLLDEQTAYRDRFLRALDAGGIDALLCPPSGLPALTHGCYFGGVAGSYALLYNLLGMPAGVVAATRVRPGEESDRPAGKDPVSLALRDVERGSTGLPVGVQVAARHWREDVVLAVMAALEHHFRKQPDYPARPPLD
jgi:fatty acid amide hydrolase